MRIYSINGSLLHSLNDVSNFRLIVQVIIIFIFKNFVFISLRITDTNLVSFLLIIFLKRVEAIYHYNILFIIYQEFG